MPSVQEPEVTAWSDTSLCSNGLAGTALALGDRVAPILSRCHSHSKPLGTVAGGDGASQASKGTPPNAVRLAISMAPAAVNRTNSAAAIMAAQCRVERARARRVLGPPLHSCRRAARKGTMVAAPTVAFACTAPSVAPPAGPAPAASI